MSGGKGVPVYDWNSQHIRPAEGGACYAKPVWFMSGGKGVPVLLQAGIPDFFAILREAFKRAGSEFYFRGTWN